MGQLSPVGGHHVGGGGQAGGAAKLGHHLAPTEALFGPARVFGIGHHTVQVAHQAHRVFEQPAPVGVKRDTCLRKAFVQGTHGLNFCLPRQHTAFELEVVEAIFGMRRLGQAHHRFGRHGFFVAQAKPRIVCVLFAAVRQVGAGTVANEKQIT